MRRYESIVIAYPDLPEEEITGLVERYNNIIKERQGIVVKVEKWGKKKLAYEINKQTRGFYFLIDFAGGVDIVTELERNFRIGDTILKYMTVKTKDLVDLQELEKEMNVEPVEEEAEQTIEQVPAAQENTETAETGKVAAGENVDPGDSDGKEVSE